MDHKTGLAKENVNLDKSGIFSGRQEEGKEQEDIKNAGNVTEEADSLPVDGKADREQGGDMPSDGRLEETGKSEEGQTDIGAEGPGPGTHPEEGDGCVPGSGNSSDYGMEGPGRNPAMPPDGETAPDRMPGMPPDYGMEGPGRMPGMPSGYGMEGPGRMPGMPPGYGMEGPGRMPGMPSGHGMEGPGRMPGMPSGYGMEGSGRMPGMPPGHGMEGPGQAPGMPPDYGMGEQGRVSDLPPHYGRGQMGDLPRNYGAAGPASGMLPGYGTEGRGVNPGMGFPPYGRNGYEYQEQGGYEREMEIPVTMGEWLVAMLLMLIPCVNIVLILVWAFSDKEKKSKSNFFKASLIYYGILLGILFLWFLFYGVLIMAL